MLRRLFLIPALAIAGIFTLASSAKAQTVNFSGIVPSSCAWGLATNGTLQYDSASTPPKLTSNGAPAASIELTCPSGGSVTVADPVVAGTNPMPTTDRSWVVGTNGTVNSPQGGGGTLAINNSTIAEILNVHMEAVSPGPPLAPGTYNFTVTLTATP